MDIPAGQRVTVPTLVKFKVLYNEYFNDVLDILDDLMQEDGSMTEVLREALNNSAVAPAILDGLAPQIKQQLFQSLLAEQQRQPLPVSQPVMHLGQSLPAARAPGHAQSLPQAHPSTSGLSPMVQSVPNDPYGVFQESLESSELQEVQELITAIKSSNSERATPRGLAAEDISLGNVPGEGFCALDLAPPFWAILTILGCHPVCHPICRGGCHSNFFVSFSIGFAIPFADPFATPFATSFAAHLRPQVPTPFCRSFRRYIRRPISSS